MLISYYANKKSSPRLPSWQPSLIFFNIPIESGSIMKPCTLKHFQVTYRLHKAGYWTTLFSVSNMFWFAEVILTPFLRAALRCRHNGRDGVSNHQSHDCLLNGLFGRKSKKTSKLRSTGLCVGNSPVTGEFQVKGPVTPKIFPFDDVIMDISWTSFGIWYWMGNCFLVKLWNIIAHPCPNFYVVLFNHRRNLGMDEWLHQRAILNDIAYPCPNFT